MRRSTLHPLFTCFLVSGLALARADAGAPSPIDSPDPRGYASELVPVPAGSFEMGSLAGAADERPVRTVAVGAFRMARTEVTVAWYLRCMADGACEPPTWWGIGYFETRVKAGTAKEAMALPITGVSWRQAGAFCAWLGPGYSLPSEAEWEYAAGAGRGWAYPWGDAAAEREAKSPPRAYLSPVGSRGPNSLGLYDFGSSVWEWVLDCYERAGESGSCGKRVSKGGSWSEHLWNLRVANRSFGFEDQGYKGLGFRVVRHEK
jgi:formylglycine-generating enzyme required for sulfatase activity